MRTKFFRITFVTACLSGGMCTIVFGQTPQKINEDAAFVSMAFRSLCGREADPASTGYYQNLLEQKQQTYRQVYEIIQASCRPQSKPDACQNVQGLNGLCPPEK